MPLIILATAMEAFNAIQKGCEMYKEVKGNITKAKKTYDEAVKITKEVKGFWHIVMDVLKPKPKKIVIEDVPIPAPIEVSTKDLNSVSELDITKNLMENLKVFFTCLDKLQAKVKQAELDALDPTKNVLSSALDIEYAMTEVEKLQTKIRETMVYQSPAELGDLYRKVVKRVGIIKEQQELVRLDTERKRKQKETEAWLHRNIIITEATALVLTLVTALIVWLTLLPLIVRHGYH